MLPSTTNTKGTTSRARNQGFHHPLHFTGNAIAASNRYGEGRGFRDQPALSEYAREELSRLGRPEGSAVTIGNFDGVHLGHRHLLARLMDLARQKGLTSVAVTLYPDPVRVLRPDLPMPYLTSLEERLELLRGLGLDAVLPLSFTSELSELASDSFVRLLTQELNLKLLLMGPDNTFGRDRQANPAGLAALGQSLGFDVEALTAPLGTHEAQVSATAIRQALAAGDLRLAAQQLGRNYSLRGPIVTGERRGRQLGFATANLAVTRDRALPAHGVYSTWSHLAGQRHASVTNIGTRPTFSEGRLSIETHVLDFDEDVYGQTLQVEFVERLRPEQAFGSVEELQRQIQNDVDKARRVLAAGDESRSQT